MEDDTVMVARGRAIIAMLEEQLALRDAALQRLRTQARQVEACWLALLAAEVRAWGGLPAFAVGAEREAMAIAMADLCWGSGEETDADDDADADRDQEIDN